VNRIDFRGRLFVILLLFALVPSIVLTAAWAASFSLLTYANPVAAWDSAAASGARALAIARARPLSSRDSAVVAAHEEALKSSQLLSKQARYLFNRAAAAGALGAVISFGLLLLVASRVAGHLSRSLSRPVQELVGWTANIARAEPLPSGEPARGAPEFRVLRDRMREMAEGLERGRRAALEAERLSALRETARQVAHELKNPLTPIRFAVSRLRRDGAVSAELRESIEVLTVETERLENLARSFAQFGKLPEGPRVPIDLGELARYTARSSVPASMPVDVTVADDIPLIHGHHDALSRALSNVMLNAVEACKDGGAIAVDVRQVAHNGGMAVELSVRDTGCGIPANRLERIWEPYVTYKSGGTGLGLAIVRQTVLAHEGEVSAASEPGKGTTIRFVLPVTASHSAGGESL